jgi:hypothetical protein
LRSPRLHCPARQRNKGGERARLAGERVRTLLYYSRVHERKKRARPYALFLFSRVPVLLFVCLENEPNRPAGSTFSSAVMERIGSKTSSAVHVYMHVARSMWIYVARQQQEHMQACTYRTGPPIQPTYRTGPGSSPPSRRRSAPADSFAYTCSGW